ncbi:MAG: relaxase/mobilization nuclease domain-containing protein [Raoultibacter sp.]
MKKEGAILKTYYGHNGCRAIKRYLEKNGRALSLDTLNVENPEQWDQNMDMMRRIMLSGVTQRGGGRPRHYYHFVIAPNPKDNATVEQTRELAMMWAKHFFPNCQVAIVCHDDAKGKTAGTPHAHVVVSSVDLETGKKIQINDRTRANQANYLHDLAKDMGLSYFEEEMLTRGEKRRNTQINRHAKSDVLVSGKELRIAERGGYSWKADLRQSIEIATKKSATFDELKRNLMVANCNVFTPKRG